MPLDPVQQLAAYERGARDWWPDMTTPACPFDPKSEEWAVWYRAMSDRRKGRINTVLRYMRVRVARLAGTHSKKEWLALCTEAAGRCVKCERTRPLTRDHILPIWMGGSDTIGNIQPLCRSCNSGKTDCTFNWIQFRRIYGWAVPYKVKGLLVAAPRSLTDILQEIHVIESDPEWRRRHEQEMRERESQEMKSRIEAAEREGRIIHCPERWPAPPV